MIAVVSLIVVFDMITSTAVSLSGRNDP